MTEFILALLSGGAIGAALVKVIGESLAFRRERKAKKEDTKRIDIEEWKKEVDKKLEALCEAEKLNMFDRIRHIGQAYIAEGEVDIDDRRLLNDMHRSYHSGLGGNGDLDVLMKEVNELPLKLKN